MIKHLLIFALINCCVYSLSAQQDTLKKSKIYETWISLNTTPYNLKGLLYEIKDTSIIVSNSKLKQDYKKGNLKVSEYYFNNIDLIKVRRINSINKGAIIGALASFTLVMIALPEEQTDMSPIYTAYLIGLPVATVVGGLGALLGSFKVRIPLMRSRDNFNMNKTLLKKYSYVYESPDELDLPVTKIEHNAFIGLLLGPSIPLGDFADNSIDNTNAGYAKTGGGGGFIAGYNFTKHLGWTVALINNTYEVDKSSFENFHSLTGFLVGPMFSTPFRENLSFDIKPMIGFVSSDLALDNTNSINGKGFGIDLSTSLRYNFSKRWCMFADAGYLFCNLKYLDKNRKKIQTVNLKMGAGYRLF